MMCCMIPPPSDGESVARTLPKPRPGPEDCRTVARLSTVRADDVDQVSVGMFTATEVEWSSTLRTTFGLRGDIYHWTVRADNPLNSGRETAAIASPKVSAAFGPWGGTEFYANWGLAWPAAAMPPVPSGTCSPATLTCDASWPPGELAATQAGGVARSRADGNWNVGSATGRLTTRLTSVQPYLRWSDGGTTIWATGGGGSGSAEHEQMRYGLQEESDLRLRLGMVEVRRRLATVGPGVELQLRGDASWARLATAAGDELIDAVEVDVSRPVRTAGGTLVEPFGEVHARHDGGSGQTGVGLEVAGGLRVARGVFRVEGLGRLLALHAADGYREHGAARRSDGQ